MTEGAVGVKEEAMEIAGEWALNRGDLVLEFVEPGGYVLYWIELKRCRTSAQVLDWIMQVAGKAWADDAVLAGLVRLFDEVLDPQACLCSFGVERGPINVQKVLGRQNARLA